MQNPAPRHIYKIISKDLWQVAEDSDEVPGMPIDISDGYMHFSTSKQLAKTLSLYFAGQSEVVILAVETKQVSHALKWEASRDGALFPHLYAPLPISAVQWHEFVDISANGDCDLPEQVK